MNVRYIYNETVALVLYQSLDFIHVDLHKEPKTHSYTNRRLRWLVKEKERGSYVFEELDEISLVAKPRLLRHIHFLPKSLSFEHLTESNVCNFDFGRVLLWRDVVWWWDLFPFWREELSRFGPSKLGLSLRSF